MNALAKSLELSSCAAACVGPKIFSPAARKASTTPVGERRFRADDRQHDALRVGESDQLGDGGERDVGHARLARGAGIAGRDEHFAHALRLRDLPRQRVLAAAAADDQYVHRAATAGRSVPKTYSTLP